MRMWDCPSGIDPGTIRREISRGAYVHRAIVTVSQQWRRGCLDPDYGGPCRGLVRCVDEGGHAPTRDSRRVTARGGCFFVYAFRPHSLQSLEAKKVKLSKEGNALRRENARLSSQLSSQAETLAHDHKLAPAQSKAAELAVETKLQRPWQPPNQTVTANCGA
jgi:hypothetical protein